MLYHIGQIKVNTLYWGVHGDNHSQALPSTACHINKCWYSVKSIVSFKNLSHSEDWEITHCLMEHGFQCWICFHILKHRHSMQFLELVVTIIKNHFFEVLPIMQFMASQVKYKFQLLRINHINKRGNLYKFIKKKKIIIYLSNQPSQQRV